MAAAGVPSYCRRPLVCKDVSSEGEGNTFSVMTYNILTDEAIPAGSYLYCDRAIRYMRYRHRGIIEEIKHYKPDIVCIQELDSKSHENYIGPRMEELGFELSVCSHRKQGKMSLGEAIYHRPKTFSYQESRVTTLNDAANEMIEERITNAHITNILKKRLEHSNQVAMVKLRHLVSQKAVHVGNTHILWEDQKQIDVQTIQIAMACRCFKEFMSDSCDEDEVPRYILTGDFNTPPVNPGYHMLEGGLSEEDVQTLQSFTIPGTGNASKQHSSMVDHIPDTFSTDLKLRSSYKMVMGSEPSVTSMDDVWKMCLDYIWFNYETLDVVAVVAPPPDRVFDRLPGLPSMLFPSDHLLLQAEFTIKEPPEDT